MTKKLEEIFDLDKTEITEEPITMREALEQSPTGEQQLIELDATIDKIDAALPCVKDITTSDAELDELAAMATKEFKNLMELGMNCDPRFGAEMFNTASSMLGHAIDAKNAKIGNKLKMVNLQIAKKRLDIQERKLDLIDEPDEGEATELTKSDRNSLLAQIIGENKGSKDK